MQNLDFNGESATDAIYNNEWANQRYSYGETGAIYDIDFRCFYGCPNGSVFWNPQFSSLIALSSIGNSYYNAGQFTLRHPSQHGLTLDLSYTLSHSIDMGSDTERSNTSYGGIQNTWNPRLSRGTSDFDTKHLISGDWVYVMPFGAGKTFLASSGKTWECHLGWVAMGGPRPVVKRSSLLGDRAGMDHELGRSGVRGRHRDREDAQAHGERVAAGICK